MNSREFELLKARVRELERLVAQLTQPKSVARLIVPAVQFYRFTLNGAWSSHKAAADILLMDGTDTGTDADVYDYLDIFSTLTTDDAGYCVLVDGVYYAIQAPCPA